MTKAIGIRRAALLMLVMLATAAVAAGQQSARWRQAGHMHSPRYGHDSILLRDGTVLVTGGRSAERYDPSTGKWLETDLALGGGMATVLADGRVLLTRATGGKVETGRTQLHLYDPVAGTERPADPIPGVGFTTVTLLSDGRVLLAGGWDIHTDFVVPTRRAGLYDPATETYRETAPMRSARDGHTATLLADGRVLVAGGTADGMAEIYDSTAETWTPTGILSEPRAEHTATLLADGRVLVAGGASFAVDVSGSAAASAEVYDPASGSWTTTEPPRAARYGHTATPLADGTVLVAGGVVGKQDAPPTCAELFDPATNGWLPAADLKRGRTLHAATLLGDGRVLVTGGIGARARPLARAVIYEVAAAP